MLLIDGFESSALIWACIRLGLAVWMLSTCVVGYDGRVLPGWERVLRGLVVIAIATTFTAVSVAGVLAALAFVAYRWMRRSDLSVASNNESGV